MSTEDPPQMLFFDILGTVVEWRRCIANEFSKTAQTAIQDTRRNVGSELRDDVSSLDMADWLSLAEEWHRSYMEFGNSFNSSRSFISVDEHNRASLEELIIKRGLRPLFNDEDLTQLTFTWHRLDPWPEAVAGLLLLKSSFTTSTLSNGNVSLLEDLQSHGSLVFTHITSAEHFGAYKPSPEVYRGAAKRFGLETSQCGMVAAHLEDLQAAKKCGFKTIYVEREMEEAWSSEEVLWAKRNGVVDIWVSDTGNGLIEVAHRLGVERDF
ncbi:unnamed protein product [Penicillium salamii]|uniref:Haloacid dehalogenase, type II n=1 Tax=Penicillium salamii TaxID=1612424 RepID=A0A9W4IQR9_9EURO|nr:unnamed protein product [Penicillium salamii]CAG8064579.1 unnamed protein product [Penicillium salamii]CAG8259260.1 unnamed protein product [Penicillium salamii]CAG8312992.1 unnamed protein product [Penicillium salamii]CAG8320480.1 unnamed protein product [Penicillium salamii]